MKRYLLKVMTISMTSRLLAFPFHKLCQITFFTGVIFMGCSNNEGNIKLKGKVQDIDTRISIPHRKIIVQALMKMDNQFITVYSEEMYSDSLGYFNYSMRKLKNVYFYNFSVVGDSAYAFSNYRLGLTELDKYGEFLTFNSSRLADLTIVIERKSKLSFHDTLYVSWETNGTDGKTLYPYNIKNYRIKNYVNSADRPFRWIGGDVESAIKTKVYADQNTIVQWKLFRNGNLQVFTDTIFCKRDVSNYAAFNY